MSPVVKTTTPVIAPHTERSLDTAMTGSVVVVLAGEAAVEAVPGAVVAGVVVAGAGADSGTVGTGASSRQSQESTPLRVPFYANPEKARQQMRTLLHRCVAKANPRPNPTRNPNPYPNPNRNPHPKSNPNPNPYPYPYPNP